MYEELYEDLAPAEKSEYLRFLGVEDSDAADLDYLDRLITAQQCTVPFENLNPMAGLPVELGTKKLYEKIVKDGRGGFCFELNSLFCRLLRACGFDAYGCRARVVRGKDFLPPCHHRGTLVRLKGALYYADVGYGGPQPCTALEVRDGFTQTAGGHTFHICRADENWWTISRDAAGTREDVIQFMLLEETECDYVTASYYCATNPDSVFVQKYMLNRRLENGSISVVGDLFTRVEDQVRTEERISDTARLIELAETDFGIRNAGKVICG